MQDGLSAQFTDFNKLVSTPLTVEFKLNNHQEEKKHKRVSLPSMGEGSMYTDGESTSFISHVSFDCFTANMDSATLIFFHSARATSKTRRFSRECDR